VLKIGFEECIDDMINNATILYKLQNRVRVKDSHGCRVAGRDFYPIGGEYYH
jgi:hypothetical protein